jgi:predicted RNase H-like HicB family nuclease
MGVFFVFHMAIFYIAKCPTSKFNFGKLNLQNVVWKEGRYYVAQRLNVDISSFGKTKKDALRNLKEALELYFEDIKIPKIRKIESPAVVSRRLQYA